MNTVLSLISAWVNCVKPELDVKLGTIGIKVVGQGNKIIDSESPPMSM